jgi:hypothetical protein
MVSAYALWGCARTDGTKPPIIRVRLAMARMNKLPVYGVTDTSSYPFVGIRRAGKKFCLKRMEACEKSLYFVELSVIQSKVIDIQKEIFTPKL